MRRNKGLWKIVLAMGAFIVLVFGSGYMVRKDRENQAASKRLVGNMFVICAEGLDQTQSEVPIRIVIFGAQGVLDREKNYPFMRTDRVEYLGEGRPFRQLGPTHCLTLARELPTQVLLRFRVLPRPDQPINRLTVAYKRVKSDFGLGRVPAEVRRDQDGNFVFWVATVPSENDQVFVAAPLTEGDIVSPAVTDEGESESEGETNDEYDK